MPLKRFYGPVNASKGGKVKRFVITEVDKDYNSPTFSVIMNFHSEEEAKKYCEDREWTGHYYLFREIKESTEQ